MGSYKIGKALPTLKEMKQSEHAERGIVPKHPFRMLVTGPSNSGKSNYARWSLEHYYGDKKKSYFDRIYLLSPTAHVDPTWLGLPGIADKDRISKPTGATIAKIIEEAQKKITGTASERGPKRNAEQLQSRKLKAPKVLVLVDDAIAESRLMNSPEYMKLGTMGRHFGISSMLFTQSYNKQPRPVRLQATHVTMFPSRTSEIEKLWEEHGPISLSKKDFTRLVLKATEIDEENKWPFLFVDTSQPEKHRFRRGLDTVLEIPDNPMRMTYTDNAQTKKKGKKRGRGEEEDLLDESTKRIKQSN